MLVDKIVRMNILLKKERKKDGKNEILNFICMLGSKKLIRIIIIFQDLTSSQVLTMQFCRGQKVGIFFD